MESYPEAVRLFVEVSLVSSYNYGSSLYVALGVNPGALEITLDSGKLSTKLQSLILEQKVERGDVALHTFQDSESGVVIAVILKKLVLCVQEKQKAQ
jgi:predicted metal-dependent TIM-barrel fold hydrolase